MSAPRNSLQLRLGQQLVLTPQLRQALRLLQLPSLELQQALKEALETNVMLEAEPLGAGVDGAEDATESDPDADEEASVEADWDLPEVYASDSGWNTGPANDPQEAMEIAGESLQEHLLWQLELSHLSMTDAVIGMALIDSINDDGYLASDLEEICRGLPAELDANVEEVAAVLHRIQSFDPVGVGARDLRETLLVQLRYLDADTPGRVLALQIAENHLAMLGAQKPDVLCRQLGVTEGALRTATALIQSLNPRPGSSVARSPVQYVIPDVLVSRRDGRWVVELNPEVAPKLRVNPVYAASLERGSNDALRQQLQEARWLIRSLEMRNETLLRVARSIVEHQKDFLEEGEEAMKPLILRNVAEQLGMHESTISRVTSHKYMYTPRGTFELKFFFSNTVSTSNGDDTSATAIRAIIRKLIAGENPKRPLSDGKITQELVGRGIKVARRTVAKYRESMTIPPSHERKRLHQ